MSDYPRALSSVQTENERVRVTEWRFPPGTATGWHTHGLDYVVVPQTDGVLTIAAPHGALTEKRLSAGQSYTGHAGTEHDVINATDREIVFIEVELK